MIKTRIEKLDLDIYNEKLDNGLEVYIVPKNTVNNIYVTFTTKYGSKDIEFIPVNEKDFYKSPYGIAHFLEHKIFEQEDGKDPFAFFTENGCSNNAYTNTSNTTYLFDGPNNFKENINYLLDFVQSPYFTDENVEKEKGIIIEELKMHKDNPYRFGYQKILSNSFLELPINVPTIGTVESIKSITKEDLYKCYNTFYNPNNMFIVVSGNVNPDEVISIIKENQMKKTFDNTSKITLKTYNEPSYVKIEEETCEMMVSIPKLFIGYKINIIDSLNKLPLYLIFQYLGMYLSQKLSTTSLFCEELKKEQIINNDIEFNMVCPDNFIEIIISAETNQPELLKQKIFDCISKIEFDEKTFIRIKKCFLSSYIYASDNIFSLNSKILNSKVSFDSVNLDVYEKYKNLKYEQFVELINQLDFTNKTSLIINPISSCQNN